MSPSPKTPTEAICRFVALAARLRGRAKAAWAASDKELDIGIQGGFRPNRGEWVVESKAVAAAARIGACLRVTVYSPLQLMKTTEKPKVPANKALQPTARGGMLSAPRLNRGR